MENEQKTETAKEDLIAYVERLEKANNEAKEILQRQEALAARNLLGGKSEVVPEIPKKEISPLDYARSALQGKILS